MIEVKKGLHCTFLVLFLGGWTQVNWKIINYLVIKIIIIIIIIIIIL